MNQNYNTNTNTVSTIGSYPIKIVPLGGMDEMGKNCYVIEVDNDAFIIEAGLKYPTSNIPGVDFIIPDFDYIRNIASHVKAIFITHGHDDQYGALPYLHNVTKAPIYATETTIEVIKCNFAKRFRHLESYDFRVVKPSDTVTIAGHTFELFETTHSIAESFGFALRTRFGNIVYTSDFMSDYSPLKGYIFDLPKVARLSENEKTFLLMTESEEADKPGIASPNHKITPQILDAFEDPTGKTFVSIYTQNFYNIQEVINLARKYKKKILIANPDQVSFFDRMSEIGSLDFPSSMRITMDQLSITAPTDVIVLVTGSGDKLFKLVKDICYGNLGSLKVETSDMWINAAPSVPGTEVIATDAADTVFRTDCHVITLDRKVIYSMHARQEDLKMMISLFRPQYYLPVKGDFRLLMANARLAIDLGVGLNHFNTFVYDNGMALVFDKNGRPIHQNITVKNGDIMVDGASVGDVKEAAIEERTKMADGGVLLIGITISSKKKKITSAPDIQMKGFLYMKDSQPVLDQISQILINNINNYLTKNENKMSTIDMEHKVTEKIAKYVLKATEKEPMILVEILDTDTLPSFDPR